MTPAQSTVTAADLSVCDREPIHIPGAVQPHGLLLVADATTLVVRAGAGELESMLAPDWLGRSLADLLDQDVAALVAGVPAGGSVSGEPRWGSTGPLAVTLHRAGDTLLAELEPAAEAPMTAAQLLAWLDQTGNAFERAASLEAVCERAAVAIRTLTGFDRVMVYRFLDDDAGRVIAEARAPETGSFLHHHFPASDIPRQARALYVRNRTRAIPMVDYQPLPLRPASNEPLDMSDVAIRSVSPIHLQYLRNMGVQASASISIVKDGLLWGLFACHHDTPRFLPPDLRAAAATLASGVARQIRAREDAESYRERLRLHAGEAALAPRLGRDGGFAAVLEQTKAQLRELFGASGFAAVAEGAVVSDGICPPARIATELARFARSRAGTEPFATHELSAILPSAQAVQAEASGLLAIPLDDGATLLWFRPEQVEEVEWAGNPHKAVEVAPGEQLTPRTSFQSWTELVRGRSRRWTLEEVEAAHRLRRTIHEARQAQQLRVLNAELGRTLADRETLIAQKDVLMKEANHRVQNSLQLVSAFLALQARNAVEGVAKHLNEAQARLAAVALVHRRLYRDDQVESIDLGRYLEELVADLKTSIGAEWGALIRLDLAPVLVPTDRAVNIGLVLTELVINATKYAYDGATGPLSIALEQHRTRFRLIVADEGRGKGGAVQGTGFGSRMMDAIVTRLDGELAYLDNQPGLRAILTAPIGEVVR